MSDDPGATEIPPAARYAGKLTDKHFTLIVRTSFCDMDNRRGGGYGAIYRQTPHGTWRKVDHRVLRRSPDGLTPA